MCKWIKSGPNRIDKCLRKEIKDMNERGIKTLGSCCGHNRYQKTIVIEHPSEFLDRCAFEIFSGKTIPRKKRFYKKDKRGYFFIPEIDKEKD